MCLQGKGRSPENQVTPFLSDYLPFLTLHNNRELPIFITVYSKGSVLVSVRTSSFHFISQQKVKNPGEVRSKGYT